MLRVCVIGMGHIGNLHARIYKEDEMVELCAVCDIIHERADEAAKKLGVKAYYDAPTMLREVKPDLVSVATGGYEYSSDHCLPTLQALQEGKTAALLTAACRMGAILGDGTPAQIDAAVLRVCINDLRLRENSGKQIFAFRVYHP